MRQAVATYGRLIAGPTSEIDLDFVLAAERDPENARFVSQWSRDEHRLWLDVMDHNPRARHLYASEGFTHEGTLREALFREGRFVSLHLQEAGRGA